MPPTVGLQQPETTPQRLSAAPQALDGELLLSTNSGFGGINAALLFAPGGAA